MGTITFGKKFFENAIDALEEAQRIRAESQGQNILVKVGKSTYGGYQVSVMPAELAVDMMSEFPSLSRESIPL